MSVKVMIERLDAEVNKIWIDRPSDIALLRKRMGAHDQNLSILWYCANDTAVLVDFIAQIRKTVLAPEADVKTLATAVRKAMEFWGSRYKRYYHMEEAPRLVAEAAEAFKEVETVEELKSLSAAVATYVGKLNYWVDLEIPWDLLTSAYEKRSSVETSRA